MNIFDKKDENFKKIQEEMGNSKRMISKLDFADAIGEAVSSATSTMVLTHDVHFANLMTAIAAKRSLDKLFHEESRNDEVKREVDPNAEFEKKYNDLKRLLFEHAAGCSSSNKVEITNHRTEEIERYAKEATLCSLIFEAGLSNEYNEWLNEKGYDF